MGYEESERLRRLTEQLLDLSQLDARRVSVQPRPLELDPFLREIVAAAVPHGPSVRFELPPELTVLVDPLVVERVVSNLVVNAARHGRPPIVVAAQRSKRQFRLAIEDSGNGVPEELLEQLFERFARGDQASGSGLGLTIARAYARMHGGDVVYKPRPHGARFELIVPQD
jgi:two-component system sensor histidine kinase MtrB